MSQAPPVTPNFEFNEQIAKSFMENRGSAGGLDEFIGFETVDVGPGTMHARFDVRGELLTLTHTEFRILRYLAEDPGRVRSRSDILGAIDDAAVLERGIGPVLDALRDQILIGNEMLDTIKLDLGARVLAEENSVAGFDV